MARAKDNQPYADLSAYAIACIIKGYADEGGWNGESMQFLRERGYLKGRELTPKGEFASKIYGYEIQMAEMRERRMFDGLPHDRLNVLVGAVVFESKKSDWYRHPERGVVEPFRRPAIRLLREIREHEERLGIDPPTKEADFCLSSAFHAWSTGTPFEDLDRHASASAGDLVRAFRLEIQLLRQTARALDPQDPAAGLFLRAMRSICRGVVDAERQLRQSTEEPAAFPLETPAEPGEAPAAPPPDDGEPLA